MKPYLDQRALIALDNVVRKMIDVIPEYIDTHPPGNVVLEQYTATIFKCYVASLMKNNAEMRGEPNTTVKRPLDNRTARLHALADHLSAQDASTFRSILVIAPR